MEVKTPFPIPFAKLAKTAKAGDICFSSADTPDWYHFSKKEHLLTSCQQIAGLLTQKVYDQVNLTLKGKVTFTFLDFGGVSANHLQEGDKYLDDPKPINGDGTTWIFSFVPTNKKFQEIEQMKKSALAAGCAGIIILTKKEGDRGKADCLNSLVKALPEDVTVEYYEDTADVLDSVTEKVTKFWVRPPTGSGFEDMVPKSKEVVTVSVDEYLAKILV